MRQALQKAGTILGIVLILSFIVAFIGAILVWANEKKISETWDWVVVFWVIIVILNLVVYFASQPAVAPVGWAIFLSSCDSFFTQAHIQDAAQNHLALAGFVMVLIGTLLSFVSFPVHFVRPQFRRNDVTKFIIILVAVLLMIGNLLIWIYTGDQREKCKKSFANNVAPLACTVSITVHPFFLALIYLLGNLWEWQHAIDFSYFAAGWWIVADWCGSMVVAKDLLLAGWILVCAALGILIILHVIKISRSTKVVPIVSIPQH